MEKRKWLWKRRSSERSPGETESSGSLSSKSERYSDDQDPSKVSSPPNNNTQSPEVSSKASPDSKEVTDSIKILTEKLSDALVNISAKEELVKQHSKVAEEAIAGWETCENEVVVLRQKLEAAVQQNSALEDRVNHLDGALKECVRQLRQAREEQEEKVHEAIAKSAQDWETTKSELESKLLELQAKAEAVNSEPPPEFNLDLWRKIEALEKKKADLELELSSQLKEMEIRTIERDLSTQAAETASKQHLEIIKKVAKLEAECRRLKTISDKSLNASSVYAESLTDSQSDSVEQVNLVQINTHKIAGLEANKEPGSSDSWASALIAELDQFKNEKAINRNLQGSTIEIDLMDDFLEMERLAALPETMSENHCLEPKAIAKQSNKDGDSLMNLEAMIHRTAELEEKLEKIEIEKAELQIALAKSHECLEASELQMRDTETKLGDLQRELYNANDAKQQLVSQLRNMKADVETMSAKINSLENEIKKERALSAEVSVNANESKKILESQLISIEADARTMSAKIVLLETEVEKERALSAQITVKCQELEEELSRKKQEAELQQNLNLNGEVKIKQEDLATAAGKLAECQKTIASLGKKLKSLATLEDFLIDTTSVPEFPTDGSSIPKAGGEPWNFRSNETSAAKRDPESPRASADKDNGNTPTSSSPSSSIVSSNHVGSEKNRNGFAKFLHTE
ncbi:TLC domain-containing protein 2-like [Hibiscus syriacus]|uniref:TLC domain-containing protein 2-like n=1 Tax=Hibiscus syriacus TaxID=106335 RepID=A0A6A2YYH6_HIBSY|nr:filament-like plant protein isoform X2 [Hibiscus syriacus]KAE8684496.1 TLC domain-containing protein 2-like [Hibiscus syriacus]